MKRLSALMVVCLLLFNISLVQAAKGVVIEEIKAQGENPPNETAEHAFDGDSKTKWLIFKAAPAWIQVKLKEGVIIGSYAITSANDEPYRDPEAWELRGSEDGDKWEVIDFRKDQTFNDRFERKEYQISNNDKKFIYYRLQVTGQFGDTEPIIQIAEIELFASGNEANPATGDAGITIYALIAMAAAAALVVTSVKRRRLQTKN